MCGRLSGGAAYGAVLGALIMSALLLCGCAGVEKDVVQKENTSLPVTTTYASTTSSAAVAHVSSLPNEGIAASSIGTPTTLIEKTPDADAACKADCEENKNPQLRDMCLRAYANSCIDESICGGIPPGENMDGCYYDLAAMTGDSLLCDRIPGNNSRALCKADFYKNSSACREITDAGMQCDCYLNNVLSARNFSKCENVFPTTCRGRCFYEYAVKYDMPELCQRADDGSRDSCYRTVAEENLDPAACAGVMIQSTDLCYLDMAAGLEDPSLCDNISYLEEDYKHWCLAAAKRNDSLCDRVGRDKWSDCIYYLARLTGDEAICEKASDKTGTCYIALAEYGKDPAYCEKIKGLLEKDRCYASSAAARSDISLCKKITDQNYKKECYLSFIQESAKEMLLGGKNHVFT